LRLRPSLYDCYKQPQQGRLKVKTIWLVIPCYNEKEVLPETSKQLQKIMEGLMAKKKISADSKVALVNDGSKDTTWNIISQLHEENPLFVGINLAHNRGHQNALFAGLMTAKEYADAAISLDADLQDDVAAIEQFIDKFLEGKDIVYGVRSTRQTDTRFKRGTAHLFYKLMNAMGADTLEDHADYRLMSRRALEALAEYDEVNLFLRGIVPMIGFETDVVYYERHERFAGESKYPLKKMLAFAVEGITSFSIKPIRMITGLGIFLFTLSIVLLLYFFVIWLLGYAVAGWTTIVLSVWGIGGLQLLALGVIGEYVGKTYLEVKHRPRYRIERILYRETAKETE
jgi:glycosyltransferase involved in cell wall biosynthesis